MGYELCRFYAEGFWLPPHIQPPYNGPANVKRCKDVLEVLYYGTKYRVTPTLNFFTGSIAQSAERRYISYSGWRRPDGLTLIPWQASKPLTWDVTVVCPLADSYIHTAVQEAEIAAARKIAKYAALKSQSLHIITHAHGSARVL